MSDKQEFMKEYILRRAYCNGGRNRVAGHVIAGEADSAWQHMQRITNPNYRPPKGSIDE